MFVLDVSQSIQLLIDLLFILLVMTGCTVLYVIYVCVCIVWMSLLSSSWQCGACCLFIQRLHHLFYLSYLSLPLSPFYPFSWLSPGAVLVSVLPLGHLHRNWMVQTRKRRVPELWVSLSLFILYHLDCFLFYSCNVTYVGGSFVAVGNEWWMHTWRHLMPALWGRGIKWEREREEEGEEEREREREEEGVNTGQFV